MSTMNLFERNAVEVFEDEKNLNIILFHGYGADAQDLFPLSRMINTKRKCNWFFPQGPLDIPLGAHWIGKAWWPISVDRYQAAGATLDISTEVPKGIEKLRTEFQKWLNMKSLDPKNTLIAGFSQGGMLAMDLFFTYPNNFAALGLLSTNIINKAYFKTLPLDAIKDKPVFISHGNSDPVLPINGSKAMESFLSQSGMKTKTTFFSGGHEIPPQVLTQLGQFIDQHLGV
jgi:phospholipase/carboxylesterase